MAGAVVAATGTSPEPTAAATAGAAAVGCEAPAVATADASAGAEPDGEAVVEPSGGAALSRGVADSSAGTLGVSARSWPSARRSSRAGTRSWCDRASRRLCSNDDGVVPTEWAPPRRVPDDVVVVSGPLAAATLALAIIATLLCPA